MKKKNVEQQQGFKKKMGQMELPIKKKKKTIIIIIMREALFSLPRFSQLPVTYVHTNRKKKLQEKRKENRNANSNDNTNECSRYTQQ